MAITAVNLQCMFVHARDVEAHLLSITLIVFSEEQARASCKEMRCWVIKMDRHLFFTPPHWSPRNLFPES